MKEHKFLLLIVLVGALLRFYKLDYQSLWIDEIFTVNIADPNNDFQFIYSFLKDHDPHPPLYYFLVHIFFVLFGYSTLVLKILSAIIGVLGIFSIYYLGKELVNKNVGLLASFLTAVNYFQIYYSQEGRMYSLLFFTTCIALYTLIKFTKKPNYKTMFYFALGSLLMIYSQFFGVFLLISIYIFLLIFIIKSNSEKRLQRFKLLILSGLLTIVLYIPSIIIILFNPERKSIWIQPPTWDTFETMFKEFFGFSSVLNFIILTIFITSLLLYLISIKKGITKKSNSVIENPTVIILFMILFTVLIPLLYSKLALPIIVSRYYICILPCILILLAISINSFKNIYIKSVIIIAFSLFSIKNLFFDKNFYSNYYKTQFKHAVKYMVQENPNDLIVSKLGDFYLKFYLNKNNYYKNTIENDINGYISTIKNDTLNLKSFWYFDGHISNYIPNEETVEFINKHYYVDDNIEFFDSFVKHFVIKTDYNPKIDIGEFNLSLEKNGDDINYYIEKYEEVNNIINISGWSYFLNQSSEDSKIQLLLISVNNYKVMITDKIKRDDVTTYFESKYNLSNSGFKTIIDKNTLEKGNYKVAIYLIDKINKKKSLVITDKFFSVN